MMILMIYWLTWDQRFLKLQAQIVESYWARLLKQQKNWWRISPAQHEWMLSVYSAFKGNTFLSIVFKLLVLNYPSLEPRSTWVCKPCSYYVFGKIMNLFKCHVICIQLLLCKPLFFLGFLLNTRVFYKKSFVIVMTKFQFSLNIVLLLHSKWTLLESRILKNQIFFSLRAHQHEWYKLQN